MKYFITVLFNINCLITISSSQNLPNVANIITRQLDQFSLKFLAITNAEAGDRINVAISPFTVWNALAIISEGARENTLRELENSLGIANVDKEEFRRSYRLLANFWKADAPGVNLETTNAIFTSNEYPLNKTFKDISQNVYGVEVLPVDFRRKSETVNEINNYISQATRNRVNNFVRDDDIQGALIFLTSTFYFKGTWQKPFNKSATTIQPFYNDANKKIGDVEMMYQAAPFAYTVISSLKSYALELPYGNGDKMSMIIFVPQKGATLSNVLNLLAQTDITSILDTLANVEVDYEDEDVHVYLPKFHVESEFNLNLILDQLGIRDVFRSDKANLLGMFPHFLHISRIIQKAVIDVDEEGTVAAAASGVSITFKSAPAKLNVNKPFAYLLVDKRTRSILFAGKVANPNKICDRCTGNL